MKNNYQCYVSYSFENFIVQNVCHSNTIPSNFIYANYLANFTDSNSDPT